MLMGEGGNGDGESLLQTILKETSHLSMINSLDEEDEIDDSIITLTNENGEEEDFEFIDLITYDGNEYVVLLPVNSDDLNKRSMV